MRAILRAFLLVLLLPWAAAADPPLVLGVDRVEETAGPRLVFDLSGPARVEPFTLTDPPRIVLDFPALAWPGGPPRTGPRGVAAIRFGLFRPGRMRMVIELDRPMLLREAFVAPRGGHHRLEIALAPSDSESFAAATGRPAAALWTAARRPSPASPGQIVVAIDPGHGGIDPGAEIDGLREKDIVLEIGLMLAERIDATGGMVPFLTREDDRFVPLAERIRLARAAGAHLFLSLHADSLRWGEVSGMSVYTLSPTGSDAAADAFAERENRADVLAGADLAGVADDVTRLLIDLARRASGAESMRLAESLLAGLGDGVDLLDTRPHRRGNFYVLKAPDMPSALIELGFLTSEADRARLRDPAWRARVVARIVAGVEAWAAGASPGFLGRGG